MTANTSTETAPKTGGILNVLLWILRIVFGLAFLAAAAAKLAGVPMMVTEFETVGLGQWFRYFTGGTEIVGALLMLWPGTVAFGSLLLLCVSIGAGVAQYLFIKQDVAHTIVFMLAMAFVTWSYRHQLGLGRKN